MSFEGYTAEQLRAWADHECGRECEEPHEVRTNLARYAVKSLEFIGEQSTALDELVKLQAHYARLLNQYDGGQRRAFLDGRAWLARLRELKAKTDG